MQTWQVYCAVYIVTFNIGHKLSKWKHFYMKDLYQDNKMTLEAVNGNAKEEDLNGMRCQVFYILVLEFIDLALVFALYQT